MGQGYQNDFEFRRLFKAYPRFLQFSGRSTRTELIGYWIATWILSYLLVFVPLGDALSANPRGPATIAALIQLVLYIPAPGLNVRRVHDVGYPTWVGLLTLLPTVAQFVAPQAVLENTAAKLALFLVALACFVLVLWKPEDGTNGYGPDPRFESDGDTES